MWADCRFYYLKGTEKEPGQERYMVQAVSYQDKVFHKYAKLVLKFPFGAGWKKKAFGWSCASEIPWVTGKASSWSGKDKATSFIAEDLYPM